MTSKAPLGVVTRALTYDDIKLFFEAIGEFGKDFQKIEQYMAQKSQNREQIRNRDQIRNFYRNLYGKLAQLDIVDKLDERVEKVVQELYLLINYGEIWKRLGFKLKFRFDKGTKKLLDELVHQGHTTLRFKNKNIRLRTPSCKALKKLNEIGIDERVKVVTSRELPKDVLVEFHPATSLDWMKVQSLSQNPRLRGKLSIQKRISSVLEFLEGKWKVARICDDNNQLMVCGNNNTEQCATSNSFSVNQIRLKPSSKHELNEVNVTRVVPDSHLDLSLTAYTKKIGERLPIKNPAPQESATLTTPDSSILFENSSTSDRPSIDQTRKHLNILQNLAGSIIGCDNSRTFCDDTQDRSLSGMPQDTFHHQTITTNNNNTINSPMIDDQLANIVEDKECRKPIPTGQPDPEFNIPVPPPNFTLGEWFGKCDGDNNDNDNHDSLRNGSNQNAHSNSIMNHMIEIKKLADGWIRQDNTSLTIGELYLAFKCPEKIVLEYTFEDGPPYKSANVDNLMFKLLMAATTSSSAPECKQQIQTTGNNKKKLKRQASNADDIEATNSLNQRVQEALKQLQPTRLQLHKRSR